MADPISLAAGGSMALKAAGAGINAYGSLQEGKAKAGAYKYQAGIARANQYIQERNADWTLESGSRDEVALGLKQRAEMGSVLAKQSASGIKVDSGSNAEVQDSLRKVQEMDRGNLMRNMQQKVRGYKLAAWEEGEKAMLADTASRNAIKAGKTGALKSLIGGAESVSDKWLSAKNAGIF